jgi:putative intracellular protease/amidase
MKVLLVLTSHDKLGDTGRKTGFWLEELAAPYYEFKDAGAQITLASPKGGRPPLRAMGNNVRVGFKSGRFEGISRSLPVFTEKQTNFRLVHAPRASG